MGNLFSLIYRTGGVIVKNLGNFRNNHPVETPPNNSDPIKPFQDPDLKPNKKNPINPDTDEPKSVPNKTR